MEKVGSKIDIHVHVTIKNKSVEKYLYTLNNRGARMEPWGTPEWINLGI